MRMSRKLRLALFEVLAAVYMLRSHSQFKARVGATLARRESLTVYDCDVMRLHVVRVVDHSINARGGTLFTGLKYVSDICGHRISPFSFSLLMGRRDLRRLQTGIPYS